MIDSDFIFPSNILVILSKECKYCKDGVDNNYLYIPNKYGSISIVDGQHRLFSYADQKVQSIMEDNCQIQVTAIDFKTSDIQLIHESSARVFIEINITQTKVEISHLDQIAYQLGSNDPKVIATRIIVGINSRSKYSSFFDVNSDKINRGIIEAGMIIDALKKITNLNKIDRVKNARTGKSLLEKSGYENLFNTQISELLERDILVGKGIIFMERYFNEIFSVFKHDRLDNKNEIKSSFKYSKFWAGFINLLYSFIKEGLGWSQIKEELKKIQANLMKLRQIDRYENPLFDFQDSNIPNSSHSPTKVCKFLNSNRQKPSSIQNINS